MPFTVGRDSQEGIVEDDGTALVQGALVLLGARNRRRRRRRAAAPVRRAERLGASFLLVQVVSHHTARSGRAVRARLSTGEVLDRPAVHHIDPRSSGATRMIDDVRVGILDVGSNTARLLVADVRAPRLVSVTTGRAHLGLGAEIADTGTLRRKTIAAAARVCRKYADRARELGAERAQVVVTAPGRQGAASTALVAALREATHLPVRILAADDEGRLAFEGAIVALGGEQPSRVGVVDVGGGSTEIVVGAPGAGPAWLRSLDVGSLRLTRLSLESDPPTDREVAQARSAARTAFAPLDPPRPVVALATGGSARALARLVGGIYDHDDAAAAVAILARRRSGKVARDVGIDPSRAGTLLAGALLLGEASRTLGRPLHLARGGLREGAALALAAEPVARAA